MKIIFLIKLCLLVSISAFSQDFCDQELLDNLGNKLEPEVTFLKNFQVYFKDGNGITEKKYSMTLNENTTYQFNIFSSEKYPGKAAIKLYSDSFLLGSSYNAKNDRYFEDFKFVCQKTGVYHLFISSPSKEESCAVGVLSVVERAQNKDKEDIFSESNDLVGFIKLSLDPSLNLLYNSQSYFKNGLKSSKPKNEFTMTMHKGNDYQINLFTPENPVGIASVKLYDDDLLVGTTYNPSNQKRYDSFVFKCQKNGTYTFVIEPTDNKETYALVAISMIKKDKK